MVRSRFARTPRWLLGAGALLALILAGGLLLNLSGFGRRDPVAYAHDPGAVLVRMQEGGGMEQPLDARLDSFPTFTLYGDGTTIYPMGYHYYQGHLDEAAIQRLLSLATYDLGFFDLPDRVGDVVYDAGSLGVQVNIAGRMHGVSMSSVDAGNDANVARLRRLSDAIDALRTSADGAYVPPAVVLYAQHDTPGSNPPGTAAWPLAGVLLETVYTATWQDGTGLRLTGADAQAALQAAAQPQAFTQNGQRYQVVAVPALP